MLQIEERKSKQADLEAKIRARDIDLDEVCMIPKTLLQIACTYSACIY
jgi:hypothetical protein